jgi:hypothetical protein
MAVRKSKSTAAAPAPKVETRPKASSRTASLRPTSTAIEPTPTKPRRKPKKTQAKKVVVTPVWVAPSEDAKLRYGILLFLLTILSIALLSGELKFSRDKVRFGNKVYQWTSSH